MKILQKLLLFFLFFLIQLSTHAQFYNGTQMNFGKNRVQYSDSFWRYLRYDNYDVYFDKEGRELADYVAKCVPMVIEDFKKILELTYPRRIIFVVCNSLEDFKQTNIGLGTAHVEHNIGGVTQITDNKITVFFTGNHADLLYQIRKGVAELFINEYLFGAENYREIISNSALTEYPEWFVQGLIEYISGNWNGQIESRVIEGLKNGSYKKISKLYGDDAVYAGLALWKFVAEMYGIPQIGNILYITGVIKEIELSFELMIGKTLMQLVHEMEEYYSDKLGVSSKNALVGESIPLPKRIATQQPISFAISPDSQQFCLATQKNGKISVWLKSINKKRTKRIMKIGHEIGQIHDGTYPSIAWHPSGKMLSMFYEAKGSVFLRMYIPETKEIMEREFRDFDKIMGFSYSRDGYKIVFTGVKRGQSNVYMYDVRTYSLTQITQSFSNDLQASFAQNDTKIVYASNRVSETDYAFDTIASTFDLYSVDIQSRVSKKLTNTSLDNEIKPQEISEGEFIFLSDKIGVHSLYYLKTDSVIVAIDTAIHYAYFSDIQALTNGPEHILDFTLYDANKYVCVLTYTNKKYDFKKIPLEYLFAHKPEKEHQTHYKHLLDSIRVWQDSLVLNQIDTLEHIPFFVENTDLADSVIYFDSLAPLYKISHVYETNFYVNQVVNQVDFGFLNTGYQKFTGSDFYYMPRLNMSLKFGVIDLFEDYRLTGGVRFFGDFNSNELLFSFENLKKRWNKKIVFHRQTLLTYSDMYSYDIYKAFDNQALASYSYPFDEARSFRITPSFRVVNTVMLSTGRLSSLSAPDIHEYLGGLTLEYVFDNVLPQELNIYNGSRCKIFTEVFGQIQKTPIYLFTFGFDLRHYQKIHRNIIFATRTAYSYSYGTSPLLYYLGGVDNWINLSLQSSKFDKTKEYDRTVNWTYQALGANMRGFQQNVRNGPSFAIMNNEVRIPIVRYFANRPIKSDFISSFQIVGFFDVGGAWNGLYPNAKENAYNYSIIGDLTTNPVQVTIDEMRQAFVYGYGYGIRSRLFGYFLRLDWAYGKDDGALQKRFYLSLSLDF